MITLTLPDIYQQTSPLNSRTFLYHTLQIIGGIIMATHEFRIMPEAPVPGKRYDKYEPENHNCVKIDDELISDIITEMESVDFIWHSLSLKGMSFSYWGVTLIPPTCLGAFIARIKNKPDLKGLKALMDKALTENKWVIHFGL